MTVCLVPSSQSIARIGRQRQGLVARKVAAKPEDAADEAARLRKENKGGGGGFPPRAPRSAFQRGPGRPSTFAPNVATAGFEAGGAPKGHSTHSHDSPIAISQKRGEADKSVKIRE